MKRSCLHIIGLLCAAICCAQQFVYSPIDTTKGLSDNFVLHVLQLHDGKIAATTPDCINLWDGSSIHRIAKDEHGATPLMGYEGAYHVYSDKQNRLWVKNKHQLWCYDSHLQPVDNCLPDSANDMFVDDQGEVYFIAQDTTDLLLDLKVLDDKQYRFYASGTVKCMRRNQVEFAAQAYLDSTAITSLVVTDTLRHRFYQLVDQKLCLEFDVQTRKWTEIFRADKLHTISLIDGNTAYIVSRDGIWSIDLNSRKAEHIDQVRMNDGTYVSSCRLNTIYTDRDGTVWIGSYDHGLLRGERLTVDEGSSSLWGIIISLLGLISVLVLLGIFYQKHRSNQALLTRNKEKGEATPTMAVDTELINRATEFVKQNIATSNYTVERLAQDLCMDRTGLYKKMMAMLGKTPTAFIRDIRIEHAATLIREGKLTMTEVAEQSGFSSASYMAKCFQENIGQKPSELRENQPDCSVEST